MALEVGLIEEDVIVLREFGEILPLDLGILSMAFKRKVLQIVLYLQHTNFCYPIGNFERIDFSFVVVMTLDLYKILKFVFFFKKGELQV